MMQPLLQVEGLTKSWPIRRGLFGGVAGRVHAVDGVDFTLAAGETLACVGESGCGKTTLGRTVLRLIEPDAGRIRFGGPEAQDVRDVLSLRGAALRRLRREMQVVFQDPYSSLNPRFRVEELIGEAMTVHGLASGRARRERVAALLTQVGLDPEHLERFPHEFSGGQRQRIGIARALALQPRFLLLDEAVSALDVSVQAQILNLLLDLQRDLGLAYLFVSHDLRVVRRVSHRVMVMYLGEIVETARTDDLFARPAHPYTRALLSAVPGQGGGERIVLRGDIPSPADPPSGCRFHTRCPLAQAICAREVPPRREHGEVGWYRCHFEVPAAADRQQPVA